MAKCNHIPGWWQWGLWHWHFKVHIIQAPTERDANLLLGHQPTVLDSNEKYHVGAKSTFSKVSEIVMDKTESCRLSHQAAVGCWCEGMCKSIGISHPLLDFCDICINVSQIPIQSEEGQGCLLIEKHFPHSSWLLINLTISESAFFFAGKRNKLYVFL